MPENSWEEFSIVRQTLAVVGVVKDVEKNLQANIDSLRKKLTEYDLSWVIVESNSTDKTREILESNSLANDSFSYEMVDSGKFRNRFEAIAGARQHALQSLKKLTSPPGLVLVIDLDQMYDWKNVNIPTALNGRDAIFAHQEPYYDLLAFKPTPKWAEAMGYKYRTRKSFLGRAWNQIFFIPKWQLKLGRLINAMEVFSAFGGAGLYSYDSYVRGRYIQKDSWQKPIEICEHVNFHESLRQNGVKMFLDPNFKLPVKNEHAPLANLILRVRKTVFRDSY